MIQVVYKRGLFIQGSFREVIAQLHEIAKHFKTLEEFITYKTKGME